MVILVKRFGQLGNRLFLFANLAANAAEHGYALANPSFARYARYFVGPASGDFGGLPVRVPVWPRPLAERLLAAALGLMQRPLVFRGLQRLRSWLPARRLPQLLYLPDDDATYDLNNPAYLAAARRQPVLLHGWCFRDRLHFRRHAARLRQWFALMPAHQQAVAALLSACRRTARVLVGVHVRRGDYATFANGQYFYDLPAYARQMAAFRALLPAGAGVEFLVCSDEPLDMSAFAGIPVHRPTGHFVEDLYALAGCDYLLGPPSSFSLWASFYGQVPLCHLHRADQPLVLDDFRVYEDG